MIRRAADAFVVAGQWRGVTTALGALLALIVLSGPSAHAHDSRPLHLLIQETAPAVYRINLFVPPSVTIENTPQLRMTCPMQETRLYACAAHPLSITINYPQANPGLTTVVELYDQKGDRHISVMGPSDLTWDIDDQLSWSEQMIRYGKTGIGHVLGGTDHILFLLLLVFVARANLIAVVTGFTASHSISLAASALGWVRVSSPAIEILIALSIIFLATEILRPRRDTFGWRYPFLVTLGFGFIHGFGFANNLNDLGLPSNAMVSALFAFNIGVEIGQVMIVVPIAVGVAAIAHYTDARLALERALAWGVGVVASYWMWERTFNVLMA